MLLACYLLLTTYYSPLTTLLLLPDTILGGGAHARRRGARGTARCGRTPRLRRRRGGVAARPRPAARAASGRWQAAAAVNPSGLLRPRLWCPIIVPVSRWRPLIVWRHRPEAVDSPCFFSDQQKIYSRGAIQVQCPIRIRVNKNARYFGALADCSAGGGCTN